MARRCWRLVKWFLDVQIVLIVTTVGVCSYLGWFPIDKQGFYCDDATIRFQFRGDTIRISVLFAVSLVVPIIVILLVEFLRHWPLEDAPLTENVDVHPSKSSSAVVVVEDNRLFSYWQCSADVYSTYFYGGICVVAIVEFLKIAVGELRPHFLDTCKPDFSTINCSDGYITEYSCLGTEPIHRIMDAYKSFPSGHATVSVYMSLYLCVFPNSTFLSSTIIQAILVIWTVYCSMSRVVDRRHHWWDVVSGIIIGAICACYSAFIWLQRGSRPLVPPASMDFQFSSSIRDVQSLRAPVQRYDYGSCDTDGDVKVFVGGLGSFPMSQTGRESSVDVNPTGNEPVRPVGVVNHVGF